MKSLNVWEYAFFFVGNFLGAGVVSGRELLEFFGGFGAFGWLALLFSMILCFLMGLLIVRFAMESRVYELDTLATAEDSHLLRLLVGIPPAFLMFSVCASMMAGGGNVLYSLTGLSPRLASVAFGAVILVMSLYGLGGVVRAFSVSVPLLALIVTGLAAVSLPEWIGGGLRFPETPPNPIVPHWTVASVVHSGFNLGAAAAIMAAAAARVREKRTVWWGTALGTLLFGTVALSILILTSLNPASLGEDLPMIGAVTRVSAVFGVIYKLLLLFAMAGTALSYSFGTSYYLKEKLPRLARYPRAVAVSVPVAAVLCSFVGFSEIVGTVYPLFGYLSFLTIGLLLYRAIRFFLKRKARE